MKRALVFLAITFGITYAYDFLVVYPIAQGTAPYASEFLSPDLAYMVSVGAHHALPRPGRGAHAPRDARGIPNVRLVHRARHPSSAT